MDNHYHQQSWKARLTYKNATMLVCFFNLVTVLLLLHGFFSGPSTTRLSISQSDADQLRLIMESEKVRQALEPLELIKRVREIEQEAYVEPETHKQNVAKQTTAVDLSKRLKDRRTSNDANNLKALEEWRIRKMERARQRELERNGTSTAQA